MLAFGGFTVFLVVRLQQGFERRAAEWFGAADEVPEEEREEVVSTAIEFARLDEQGRPVLQGRAEQALGRSDGQQRFLEVEVRLIDVYGGGDAVVAADELLIDTRTEALEFLGNALLRVEGLELSGPHLQFRRAPDRLWSRDPVQFRSDDFVGIAASLQFEIAAGRVVLRGVVAAPAADGGFSVLAERVRFERDTADTTLFGDVEIRSDRLVLTSQESVVARRDRERGRMRSLEAGFGTALTVLEEVDEEDAAPGSGPDPTRVTLRGDEVEIDLEEGRVPRLVRVKENLLFSGADGAELRARQGGFALDPAGKPEQLRMSGEVTSRLPAGEDGRALILVDAAALEVAFDSKGKIAAAVFRGQVEARYGRASATAESADWNGVDTLILEGAARVVDSSLLELEGGDLRLIVGEESRIEAAGAVNARFLPARLGWLPGRFDGVVVTGESAVIESGSGRGAFAGGVRLLFGKNRLRAQELEVDADGRTLVAAGEVTTSLELDVRVSRAATPEAEPAASANPEAGAAGNIAGIATEAPGGEASPPPPFRFSASAESFRYEGGTGRLSYRGAPRLEREEPSGEVSRLVAGRIDVDLAPDGSLGAVRGVQGARFDRGSNRVRGSRIRYEPGADVLIAWGSPAIVELDGRASEGGLLELALADNRSEIHPTRLKRALTRIRVANPSSGPSR